MNGRHDSAAIAMLGLCWLLACSTDARLADGAGGGPGSASHVATNALVESPAARAVVEGLRAMHVATPTRPPGEPAGRAVDAPRSVLPPSVVERFEREGGRLVGRVQEIPKGSTARRANTWLGATAGDGLRVEDDATKLAVTVRPVIDDARAAKVEAEIAEGFVVYRGAGPSGADLVHRVTAEGTEDYVAFERRPAMEELSYEVTLSMNVAGVRVVAETIELVDTEGIPRLRMAPPYLIDAAGRGHAASVTVLGCAYTTTPGARPEPRLAPPQKCTVHVGWGAARAEYPVVVDPAWTTTGSMATARNLHTASVAVDGLGKQSGPVLVAGGYAAGFVPLASAELYDPASKTWSATASMVTARARHTASSMPIGTIFVVGGYGVGGVPLASAEQYNPFSKKWSAAGSMAAARGDHTASALENNTALVAGGNAGGGVYLASAELYDGNQNTWSTVGSMATARTWHTASVLHGANPLLTDILVVGGYAAFVPLASAELYDPGAKTWSAVGSLGTARMEHTATILLDGTVLVAGGDGGGSLASAELYDPAAKTWSAAGTMATARDAGHTASVLADGKVLVAGGANGSYLASAELYDPAAKTWSAAGNMATARGSHTASMLADESVLVAGGDGVGNVQLASAELFSLSYPIGAPCGAPGDCLSGFCADGFCCNSACASSCDVCAMSLGAAADGFCGPAPLSYAGSPSCTPYACDGMSVTCPGSCASDATCGPSYYCALFWGCQPQAPTGTTCGPAVGNCKAPGCRECSSGSCSDGFCCDAACSGSCDACAQAVGASADGTCTTLVKGHAPQSILACGYQCDGLSAACPSSCSADTDCATGYYCDAKTTCQPQKVQGAACNLFAGADCALGGCRACATGNCVDGVCCDAVCNGGSCDACAKSLGAKTDGTCTLFAIAQSPEAAPLCIGYVCDGVSPACPSGCKSDAGCASGYYCANGGTCLPQKVQGAACNPAANGDCLAPGCAVCNSGACSDGLCCDALCDGPCDACSVAAGSSADGVCKVVALGHAPNPSCGDYLCGGASSSCPTKCTDDSQCIATAYCTPAHTCVPEQAKAAPCTSQDQCANGICVDGFCCDQACGGECEACDVEGAHGTCSAVAGAPHGSRPPCTGMASGTCAGSCDGEHTAACTYTGATTTCGSTCKGNTLTTSTCDGKGDCVAGTPAPCASELVCAEGGFSCKATCTSPADCAQGFECSGGKCTPATGAKCVDAQTSQNAGATGDAGVTTCTPYICDQGTGACLQMCTSTTDCVSPAVCNPSGQCVAPPTASNPSSGSTGGCSASAQGTSGSGALGLFGLALLAARARRRTPLGRRGAARERALERGIR